MSDHADTVREALEAAYHIAECREHESHLIDAENAARKAVPALDALVAERDEARRQLLEQWDGQVALGRMALRAEAAEAERDRLSRCLEREETMGSAGLARERELAAERDRYKSALKQTLACTGHWGDSLTEPAICRECQEVARAALSEFSSLGSAGGPV